MDVSEERDDFELANFLRFKLERGGEDSAAPEDLNFKVKSDGVEGDELKFKFDFEKPEMVSIGA